MAKVFLPSVNDVTLGFRCALTFRVLGGFVKFQISICVVRKLRRTTYNKYACGELSAKNGFGGYVGFEPFVGVLAGTTSEVLIMKREVVEKAPEKIRMR